VRVLWFNAATTYNLSGAAFGDSHPFILGNGLANNGRLVTVYNSSGQFGAETIINSVTRIYENNPSTPRTFVIENESEGGLGFLQSVQLNNQNLIVAGGKATLITAARGVGQEGRNRITVQAGPPGAHPTHLVLTSSSHSLAPTMWQGQLHVHAWGMAILKHQYALSSAASTVSFGGTMAWRSHIGNIANEYYAIKNITVFGGRGVTRQRGRALVGAVYNDGGKNRHNGNILINNIHVDSWLGSRGDIGGYLDLSGQLFGGNGALAKVGPGLIILSNGASGSNANNFWGMVILGGVLRYTHANALPTNSVVALFGGILELGGTDFQGAIGGRIRWRVGDDGGFSASGGNRTVSLNGGASLTWGQQFFVGSGRALLLGSRYGDSTITFANALDLANGVREVRVGRGVLPTGINATGGGIDAILSGQLSNGGLRKTGDGLLQLTSTSNSYTGNTVIAGGGLLSNNIPSDSNIVFDAGPSGTGGILLLEDDFTRSLGTGAGQVRWTGSGGFAASGDDRTVSLGGTTAYWGLTPGFVLDGSELRFGHYYGSGTLIWEKPIDLNSTVSSPRTIRIERSEANKTDGVADVVFQGHGIDNTNSSAHLYIVGDGRFDMAAENDALNLRTLHIYGAEFRLNEGGTLQGVEGNIDLRYGGTLTLDNVGTYNSDTGGFMNVDRLNDDVTIQMRGGRILPLSIFTGEVLNIESVKRIEFLSGANTIDAISRDFSLFLGADTVFRNNAHRSTLYIPSPEGTSAPYYLLLNTLPQAGNINGITPWITIGRRWGSFVPTNTSGLVYDYFLSGTLQSGGWTYNISNNQNTWPTSVPQFNNSGGENYNIVLTANQILNVNRYINSLILSGQTTLSLSGENRQLILYSGGLMTTGTDTVIISGHASSRIVTANASTPLYLQINNNRGDLIKTGPGERFVSGSIVNHVMRDFYIHQGGVRLWLGTFTVGRIYIGDGAGTAVLHLRDNMRDQIKSRIVGWGPSITIHGTPYAQRGPEYGGDQAILRMGGNTKLHLSNLHIEQRGTIWVGGEVSQDNILYLDNLTFSGPDAILFMRNWYEYEDYLLVNRTWFDGLTATRQARLKSQVRFEGYEDFPIIHRDYDATYYQITPFGAPEPATYGAILAAAGIGLVAWRRRKKQ